jgi:hypothetical protein
MPDTFMLSNIRNWRNCDAGIPDGYELAAVVDAITGSWDSWECIEATATQGVAEEDKDAIRQTVDEYRLSIDPESAILRLHHDCIRDVLISRAKKEDIEVRVYRSPNLSAYLLHLPDDSWAAYRAQWLDDHPMDTAVDMDAVVVCPIVPAGESPEKALAHWSENGMHVLDTIRLPLWVLISGATGGGISVSGRIREENLS